MSGMDVSARLRRVLVHHAGRCGLDVTIPGSSATRWASATFSGARHEIALTAPDSDVAEHWLADLPEAELALAGHLIADLKIIALRRSGYGLTATVEVLTVEDR